MAHRVNNQLGLADALVHPGIGHNQQLERIAQTVDWGGIEHILAKLRSGERGAPPYPGLLMFKALLLQQWYQLSDPGLEQALSDRLSFRRFLGLRLEDPTPDHSTLWRFREALKDSGVDQALFDELQRQLDARGLLIKHGSLIDATLVQAQASAPPPGHAQASSDPDAAWARKGAQARFGYKAHVAVDERSQLIRRALLTAANVNETQAAEQLICGDEAGVYADAAYDTHARRRRLRERGVFDGIMHRPNKHHPRLPARQRAHNRAVGRIRSRVETVFGIWKRHYGYVRVRYFGLARNFTQLRLLAMATNLKRMLVLCA